MAQLPNNARTIQPVPASADMWSTTSAASYQPRLTWRMFQPRYWGSWLVAAVVAALAFAPWSLTIALGGWIGDLFRKHNHKRRNIVETNLRLCFPQLSAEERASMVRAHFRSYGQSMLSLGRLWWTRAPYREGFLRFHGLESMLDDLRNGERVIIIVPHAVAMEYAFIPVARFTPAAGMLKRQSNEVLDYLINKGRLRFGGRLILREQGLRPLLQAVKKHAMGIYVPDEDFGPQSSVFAPFFGVQTSTLTTLGRMARITNAQVRTSFAYLRPDASGIDVSIGEPITGFPCDDAHTDAALMNADMEHALRAAPEQYMWTFRMFRTRPAGEDSPYD